MSLLSVLQDVAVEVGVDVPDTIIGNTNANVPLLLRFAQKAGSNIASRHDWSKMIVQYTFTSIAAEAQPSAFPADFDRMNEMSDVWDRSRNLRYIGPANIKDWQWFKNGAVAGVAGVIGYWRIIGGQLNMFPAPPAGKTIALEYISKSWATDAAGNPRITLGGRFEADTDVARFPEELIGLETVWRVKHRRGLDYDEDMSDAERSIERAASNDSGKDVIGVGRSSRIGSLTQNITWPGVILPG